MARSGVVTKNLLERLLRDQARRAQHERDMSFEEKLRAVDRLMAEGAPKFEDVEPADLQTNPTSATSAGPDSKGHDEPPNSKNSPVLRKSAKCLTSP